MSHFHRSRLIVIVLGLVLIASGVVVVWFRSVIPQVSTLYEHTLPHQPYFVPVHAGLLYLVMPLVIIAALVFLLAPGILFVLTIGGAEQLSDLILKGFGAALVSHFIFVTACKSLIAKPLDSTTFMATALTTSALIWGVLATRVWQGINVTWPWAERSDRRRLCWLVVIPFLMVVLLLPAIFWQDFNPDGMEALLLGRSLSNHVLPRLATAEAQNIGLGIGMITQAYPVAWFVMLFGPIEAAARLPLVLYIPVLFAGLIALIELYTPRQLRLVEEAVLVLGLAVFVTTMSYSASYSPYYADIAAPAAFESLTVLCMLGVAYFLWTRQCLWFLLFSTMTYLARPTGLLILVLLGLGIALSTQQNLRPRLRMVAMGIGSCLLLLIAYETMYVAWAADEVVMGDKMGNSVLYRLRFLKLDDFSRFLYFLVPSGLLPGMSLFAFRLQDPVGRSLAIVCLAYFVCFFVPAFVSLHQFVPVMILPLVVFWRLVLARPLHWGLIGTAATAASVALWISLPRHFEVDRTVREIGQATRYQIGDHSGDYLDQRTAFERRRLLHSLFSPRLEIRDPFRELVAAPEVVIHYSAKKENSDEEINYVVQTLSDPLPTNFTKVADDGTAAVYVRDIDRWHHDRYRSLPTDYRSPAYEIPPETLFRTIGVDAKNYDVDLKSVFDRF